MIECSNCKELIGDYMVKCPFCFHPISEEERTAYMEKQDAIIKDAIQEVMNEYSSRVHKGIVIEIVFFIIDLICFLLFLYTDTFKEYIFLVCMVLGVLGSVPKLMISRCPYCKKDMSMKHRSVLLLTYCPRCGGQLR